VDNLRLVKDFGNGVLLFTANATAKDAAEGQR